MRSILALVRASWKSAASYRVGMVLNILSMGLTLIPIYFLSDPIGVVAGDAIKDQAQTYFGFALIGMCGLIVVTTALSAVPASVSGTIGSGTLEALVVTRTPLWQTFLGLGMYGFLWSGLRATLMLAGGAALGLHVIWSGLPAAAVLGFLLIVSYYALGMFAAALILVFRTAGPFNTIVLTASGLLGGLYIPTSKIPGWLGRLPVLLPMSWALPPIRRVLLLGDSFSSVTYDILVLAGMSVVLLVASTACFVVAFRYARKAGTLSQY